MEKYDVIIIGAGAAGMMAAKILSAAKMKVCMLEARDRTGGRIHTITLPGFSKQVEAAAEFIHGKLPLTLQLLKEAGIQYYETEGELWQVKNNELKKREDFIEHADQLMKKLKALDHDMSIAAFLATHFTDGKYTGMKHSLQQYIEGYEAADIHDFSALALMEEWESEDEEQYRIEGGYITLIDHLKDEFLDNGGILHLNTTIKKIRWQKDAVEVITKENKTFTANKLIVTVPPVFLSGENEGSISFEPELPAISAAAKEIAYGGVIKINLEFDHPFWETGEVRKAKNMFFIFSDEKIPTWWSQLPDRTPVLAGWLAGPKAKELEYANDDKILGQALQSLSSIFDINIEILQQYIKGSHVCNWLADPFSKGAYSYSTVTSPAAKKILSAPVNNTLFFAGEAINKNSNATVEAALQSGKDVAETIVRLTRR